MRRRGLWIWRLDRAGGPPAAINAALRCGFTHIIVKTRDGLTPYNRPDLDELSRLLRHSDIQLYVWAWVYARNAAPKNPDVGGRCYVAEQAARLAEDARQFGATGIVANIEAPFSWALNHRWGLGHRKAWGSQAQTREELELRARLYGAELAHSAPHQRRVLSTFPLPAQHALPFAALSDGYNEVWPQLYFGGTTGLKTKMFKSIEQWRRITKSPLRFTGPLFRGPERTREVELAADIRGLGTDWWALDKSAPDALNALESLPTPVTRTAA